MKKNSKGITLVALVVTIVILLILAGISISSLTQTGLFGKAKQAEQKSKEAQEQENATLGTYENELNKYITNRNDEIQADGSWNNSKKVNSPELMEGMTGVYWDDKGQEVTVTADNQDNWYDYENQKWANAKTQDGSYWVWIPRYAYKIESGCYTSNAGEIKIRFLKETSNKDKDNNIIKTTYPTVTNGAMQDYVVHPSFTNGTNNHFMNGEWDKEITGYWVAKYAAGFQASTTDAGDATKVVNGSDTIVYSNKKYTTYNSNYTTNAISQTLSTLPTMSYPVFKPLTYAYNCITTGDAHTLSKEIATANSFYGLNSSKTDSHQMKNSEWGAVAYLAQSSCGRNKTDITINSKNLNNLNSKNIYAVTGYAENTANGVDASTTNSSSDGNTNNYIAYSGKKLATYGFGDAILEISTSGSGSTSWNGDYSYFPYTSYPFFMRGGSYDNGSVAGSFAFSNTGGHASHPYGFRSVLVAL